MAPSVNDSFDQRFLIAIANAVSPVWNRPGQRKYPIKIGGCAQDKHILILLQICFYPLLQISLRHSLMVRAGYCRSFCDNDVDFTDPPVQNFIHNIAAHPMQPEITGV